MERISRIDFLALVALAFGLAFTMGMSFEHLSGTISFVFVFLVVILVVHLFLSYEMAFPE